jgi:hypothetical protein
MTSKLAEKYMYKCIPITGIKLKKKILINTMILSRAAALAPKMLAPEKSPGIKFCRQDRWFNIDISEYSS